MAKQKFPIIEEAEVKEPIKEVEKPVEVVKESTNKDILNKLDELVEVVEAVKNDQARKGKNIARYIYFIKHLQSRELRRRFA